MRRMLTALLALLMVIGSTASVALAQDATPEAEPVATGEATAFADGFDAPATYFSDRGDPVATITVTDIERGWQEFNPFSEPGPGFEYVAATFEVENLSRGNMIATPFDFSMLDTLGRNNSRSFVSVDEESVATIFDEDVAIASGETVELTIIFELYEQTEFGYFMWQPDSGVIVMVDLQDV